SPLPEDISFDSIDVRVARTTYPSRALGDHVKDRLNLGWRGGDHPQDFARCRLPLQGLFGLVEQAHVLYRDRGLVGEGFEETDLLGRECVWFSSSQDENADDIVLAFQRDSDDRSDVEGTGARVVLGVRTRIHDRGRLPIHHDTARPAAPVGDDGLIRECSHERDLPIGEWAYLVPSQHEHAGDRIATKEGYAEHRSIAAEDLEVPRRVFAVGEDVGNVDDRPLQRRTSDERLAPWRARRFVGHTLVFGVARSPERRRAIDVAVEDVDRGTLGAAQAGGAIEDGIEYDGKLAWSTPHEAEDFRERGLAGTRLRELLFEVGRSAQGWSPLPGQC